MTLPDSTQPGLFFGIIAGSFLTEEGTLATSAVLMAQGKLGMGGAVLANFIGIVLSNLLVYSIGFLGGEKILRFRLIKQRISAERMAKAQRFCERWGYWVVPITRFMPGTRILAMAALGTLKSPIIPYTLALMVTSALWVGIALKLIETGTYISFRWWFVPVGIAVIGTIFFTWKRYHGKFKI